jgi:glycosyltransferase involved in cell wall biosynthesis
VDFLSFSGDYWDGPRHNRHYFCEELSKSHRVLFCSPPFYIVKLIEQLGRHTLSRSGVHRRRPNLVNYVPSKFLFTNHRWPGLNEWTKRRRHQQIRELMRRESFDRPILLLWHPMFREMIGRFDESLVVYYVYDQYSGYAGGAGATHTDPAEVELLERADVVFVLSKELYETKKGFARNIHHLPNSVDFELFSRARDTSTPVPADLAAIKGPRVGYIGTMNEKLNVPLLEHIADKRADWSVVLVGRENYQPGRERDRFNALVARENVHWLGARPYDSVPAYIKGLDVCMMCYVINDWTFFGDPSKMHEYLASGKPTVATGLSAIKEFSTVIDIPETFDGWVDAIDRGLRETDTAMRDRRIETARQNSYPFRVESAVGIIRDALARRR